MSHPPYRALRVVLGFLSFLMAIGGVVLIVSSRSLILRLFLHPPEAEVSTLFLFTLKELGGFALMLAVMVFFAARPSSQCRDHRRARGRTLHTRGHASRVSFDAGHPDHLSRTSHLGALRATTGAGSLALLPKAERKRVEACGEFLKVGALLRLWWMPRLS